MCRIIYLNKKSTATPLGNMPVLEVDGQAAGQSMAILRYLGKRFGLTGSNAWEELLVDGVADTFADFRQSKFFLCLYKS